MQKIDGPRVVTDEVRFANPLGLIFSVPKSEPNLESSTFFPNFELSKKDDEKDRKNELSIPKGNSYTFTIS